MVANLYLITLEVVFLSRVGFFLLTFSFTGRVSILRYLVVDYLFVGGLHFFSIQVHHQNKGHFHNY